MPGKNGVELTENERVHAFNMWTETRDVKGRFNRWRFRGHKVTSQSVADVFWLMERRFRLEGHRISIERYL